MQAAWGIKEEKDGEVIATWGNAGTGYFWLSYYDQSICEPESFDLDIDTNAVELNFPIRSYPQTEVFSVVNSDISFKDGYSAGETLEGKIYVTNNSNIDFDDDTEIELLLTIGQEVKNYPIGKIGAFKSKESKEFTYHYTVTGKDAEKGEITSTVTLLFNGAELGDTLFEDALTFTVPAVVADAKVSGADDTNPGTGVASGFGLVAVCALTAGTALVVKKRK